MSKAGKRLIERAQQAVEFARGIDNTENIVSRFQRR
jgi:hypothetical protein